MKVKCHESLEHDMKPFSIVFYLTNSTTILHIVPQGEKLSHLKRARGV